MNIIVACDKNYGIGKDNKIVWNLKEDMKRFKTQTTSHRVNIIIMGKNTFSSFKTPLTCRENFVVSKTLYNEIKNTSKISENNTTQICNIHKYILYNGFYIFETFEKAYDYGNSLIKEDGKIWVIGGSILYEYVMKNYKMNSFYLTIIDNIYDCDTYLGENTIHFIENCNWSKVNSFALCNHNIEYTFYDFENLENK